MSRLLRQARGQSLRPADPLARLSADSATGGPRPWIWPADAPAPCVAYGGRWSSASVSSRYDATPRAPTWSARAARALGAPSSAARGSTEQVRPGGATGPMSGRIEPARASPPSGMPPTQRRTRRSRPRSWRRLMVEHARRHGRSARSSSAVDRRRGGRLADRRRDVGQEPQTRPAAAMRGGSRPATELARGAGRIRGSPQVRRVAPRQRWNSGPTLGRAARRSRRGLDFGLTSVTTSIAGGARVRRPDRRSMAGSAAAEPRLDVRRGRARGWRWCRLSVSERRIAASAPVGALALGRPYWSSRQRLPESASDRPDLVAADREARSTTCRRSALPRRPGWCRRP